MPSILAIRFDGTDSLNAYRRDLTLRRFPRSETQLIWLDPGHARIILQLAHNARGHYSRKTVQGMRINVSRYDPVPRGDIRAVAPGLSTTMDLPGPS